MNREEIIGKLSSCLLTDEEMAGGPEEWAKYENPFYNDDDLTCEVLPPVTSKPIDGAERMCVTRDLSEAFSSIMKPDVR